MGYLLDHLDFGEVPINLYLQRREQKLRGRADDEPDVLARQDKKQDSIRPLVVDDDEGGNVLDDDHVLGEGDYQAVDTDASDINLHEE